MTESRASRGGAGIGGTAEQEMPAQAGKSRLDVALAVVIVTLLAAGMGAGASRADRQEPLLRQPVEASGAEFPVEFEYFPSKYVNQGVESWEELPTF